MTNNLSIALQKAKINWEIEKSYERNAINEVYQYALQFYKENQNKICYNADIKNFILQKEEIPEELQGQLDTEIYLSQRQKRKEKEEIYKNEMINNGWKELAKEIVKFCYDNNKKLLISSEFDNILGKKRAENVYKTFVKDDIYMLLKPRATKKGYYLHQFEKAFYKII